MDRLIYENIINYEKKSMRCCAFLGDNGISGVSFLQNVKVNVFGRQFRDEDGTKLLVNRPSQIWHIYFSLRMVWIYIDKKNGQKDKFKLNIIFCIISYQILFLKPKMYSVTGIFSNKF